MTRLLLVAALLVGLAGCLDEELNGPAIRNKPVELPEVSEASVETAARVDQVGRQLLSHNLFLGVEPTFQTYGQKDPEIFHPDFNGVFVAEGLVARCKTDEELAAVLATELATMSIERRAAERLRGAGPLPPVSDAAAVSPGGISADQNQLGTQAMIDRQLDRQKRKPSDDPHAQAKDILEAAGIDPKVLDQVAPLVREAGRHHATAEGLAGRPTRPRWSN
ncbi:MAG TPA: hypothetical protein VFG68_03710 [Fimbriiglobus sp.]|nr:hypothetical protein [Fimbriiglobus sp.]